jgi:hypothetical protein
MGSNIKLQLTSSGLRSLGILAPSLLQKQYGNSHSAGLHRCALSIGASVIGATARNGSLT